MSFSRKLRLIWGIALNFDGLKMSFMQALTCIYTILICNFFVDVSYMNISKQSSCQGCHVSGFRTIIVVPKIVGVDFPRLAFLSIHCEAKSHGRLILT